MVCRWTHWLPGWHRCCNVGMRRRVLRMDNVAYTRKGVYVSMATHSPRQHLAGSLKPDPLISPSSLAEGIGCFKRGLWLEVGNLVERLCADRKRRKQAHAQLVAFVDEQLAVFEDLGRRAQIGRLGGLRRYVIHDWRLMSATSYLVCGVFDLVRALDLELLGFGGATLLSLGLLHVDLLQRRL